MTVTLQDLITLLPKTFLPEKAAGVDADVLFNIIGDNGGDWTISIHNQNCAVMEGITTNPRLSLTAQERDLLDIFSGKLDGMKAFMSGKLKVSGDMSLALKLTGFFSVTPEILNALNNK